MEKVTKINLTPENFHSEMFYMPNKIGMTNSGNSFRLLVEAFRRKHFLKSSPDFLGLGRPSDYKSDLFKPSFGLIQKGLNWFREYISKSPNIHHLLNDFIDQYAKGNRGTGWK